MGSSQIQHVFILMLENRSFDHMLGFSGLIGTDASTGVITKVNGLSGAESNPLQWRRRLLFRKGAPDRMPADPGPRILGRAAAIVWKGSLHISRAEHIRDQTTAGMWLPTSAAAG